jgi:MoaA/NifB/PqqE/SkfB family radical SAM enzyme
MTGAAYQEWPMSTDTDRYQDYVLPEYPDYVVVDTTYTCNIICGMCHLSSNDFRIPANPHISVDLIRRMLPLLKKSRTVFLLGRGEPLMHPKIYDIVSLIKNQCPDIYMAFTSNGILLTKRNISKLLDAKLDQINISLDGPDIERGHPQFDRVKANLRELAVQKAARGVDYPAIHISYVIGKDNETELKPTLEFGIEIGIHGISIEPLRIMEPNPKWDDYIRENDVYKHLDTVVPIVDEIRILARERGIELTTLIPTNLDPNQRNRNRGKGVKAGYNQKRHNTRARTIQPTFVSLKSPKCDRPFTMLRVEMDGSTYMCQCEQRTGLNAFEVDPIEIWNSSRATELRRQIDMEEYDSTCLDCHILRNKLTYEAAFERKRLEPDGLALSGGILTSSSGNIVNLNDSIQGFVETLEIRDGNVFVSGWAADLKNGRPCMFVVVFINGVNTVVMRPTLRRPDVAQAFSKRSLEMCGFTGPGAARCRLDAVDLKPRVWAIDRFGCAGELSHLGPDPT